MTSISDTANVISFFAGSAALVGVARLLHSQSVDQLRSLLFSLRDEMFSYAVDNNLLANQAYRDLRAEMNGFIRYAHKINATQMLLLDVASRFHSIDRTSRALVDWTVHLSDLNDNERKMLVLFSRHAKENCCGTRSASIYYTTCYNEDHNSIPRSDPPRRSRGKCSDSYVRSPSLAFNGNRGGLRIRAHRGAVSRAKPQV